MRLALEREPTSLVTLLRRANEGRARLRVLRRKGAEGGLTNARKRDPLPSVCLSLEISEGVAVRGVEIRTERGLALGKARYLVL